MGISDSLPKGDKIIWIDENIKSKENIEVLHSLEYEIDSYKIFPFNSVEAALNFITSCNNWDYNFIYIIVSGRLADDFTHKYIPLMYSSKIIISLIIYCYNLIYYLQKYSLVSDYFLKPQLITNNYKDIINYINKEEQKYSDYYYESITVNVIHCILCNGPHTDLKVYQISDLTKRLSNRKDGYKNTFTHVKNLYEISFPSLIGQIIDDTMIKADDLKRFQSLLLNSYKKQNLTNLIIPSRNKKINIPYELLSIFYIHLYTKESDFYKDMNFILTYGEGFHIYKPYIYILYNSIHKKVVHSYGNKKLYRGGKLTKKELDEMESAFKKKKECKNSEISELLYYTNNFLSFSKNENVADEFIKASDNDIIPVKFIINEVKDKNFFISNIEISQYSDYSDEDEVLILPLTCFTIENIYEKKINNISVKIINLQMLDSYKNRIENYMKNINQEQLQNFYEKSLKTEFGKDLYNNFGKEIHDNFQKEIEKETGTHLQNIDIKPPPPPLPIQHSSQDNNFYMSVHSNQPMMYIPYSSNVFMSMK